ncbi:MAG: tRNA (adenosine(37)-N6)-dimethylallyltransferase MiaA [Chitinispirillaceae bacterium]|nr:tRNA (adenosine(37)-N6)-dimethylallyltransferase MiaA [Chitinispirillaceae bacterium]
MRKTTLKSVFLDDTTITMKNRYKKNCVVICGPTASGKTRLAVELALQFHGEIISADSRQVYRRMDIGTGKDRDEYATVNGMVTAHLIDIKDPGEVYTLYQFKQDFFITFDEIVKRDNVPFLTGGTGLYIESVLRNYDIPHVPEDIEFRKLFMTKNKEELINELKEKSPHLYARTDLSSKKRVVRSLEIASFGPGAAMPQISREDTPALCPVVLCTRWERAVLRERIDRRLDIRIKSGMIDEVKDLMDSGVPIERLIQMGMEYKHITWYLQSKTSYEQMIDSLKKDIHQLAKRQETWFRGMERRGTRVHWIDNSDFKTAEQILSDELARKM